MPKNDRTGQGPVAQKATRSHRLQRVLAPQVGGKTNGERFQQVRPIFLRCGHRQSHAYHTATSRYVALPGLRHQGSVKMLFGIVDHWMRGKISTPVRSPR
jgi:hypothetical protein